jgi:hypothetical protein
MAYKTIPVYNLDAQVGPQKANRTDDVKLVQGLLRLAMQVIPESATFETPQITGVFDDKTRIAIVFLQRWLAADAFKHVKRDDFLDPMPSKRGGVDFETMAPNGHVYTIYFLNVLARKHSAVAHDNLGRELGLVEAAGFLTKLPIK